MSELLVSVVIPTFNRAVNLSRAIESALNQTYRNIEVIVVDDNNPTSEARKSTELLMAKYHCNDKVKYIKHSQNKNGAAARNTGISTSKGYYIAFLDDDDEWESDKIIKQVEYLNNEPSYSGCYCLSRKYIGGVQYYLTNYQSVGALTFDLLSLKSEIYTPTLIFKKSALSSIGGFDESFIRHQDYELLVKFFRTHTIGCVPKYLVNVHVDDNQNHLNFDRFRSNKFFFLEKFRDEILKFDKYHSNQIYQAHYFELFYCSLKSRRYIESIQYFIRGVPKFCFLWDNKLKILSIFKRKIISVIRSFSNS